MFAIATGVDKA